MCCVTVTYAPQRKQKATLPQRRMWCVVWGVGVLLSAEDSLLPSTTATCNAEARSRFLLSLCVKRGSQSPVASVPSSSLGILTNSRSELRGASRTSLDTSGDPKPIKRPPTWPIHRATNVVRALASLMASICLREVVQRSSSLCTRVGCFVASPISDAHLHLPGEHARP